MINRSFRHWTPRYILDRVFQMRWMHRNPQAPWLSRCAVEFLDQYLLKSDQAIEFGSGGSTIWFAERVNHLISVEHDTQWFDRVSVMIQRQSVSNVDYRLIDLKDKIPNYYSIDVLNAVADRSIDFILVDGIFRDYCALAALPKLRLGGLLVIDDAQRYLPSTSRSPYAIPPHGKGCSELWEKFSNSVVGWRSIWFSDGVRDDAFFFKKTT